ncbi:MAG: hypothetical protein ACI4UE_05285 [Candidatus Scatovivens sp.]
MKKTKKIVKNILLIFLIIITIQMFAYQIHVKAASSVDDTAIDIDSFGGKTTTVTKNEAKALNIVLGVVQLAGVGIAVIMIIYLGIKYMVSSVSDRAEIKKHAVIYVLGAVIMFGAAGIVEIIKTFAFSLSE